MKITKYLTIISFLFIGTIPSATAQDFLSAELQEEVAKNVSDFVYELNLSERDKPAFHNIIRDFFIGLVAVRATDYPMKTNRKILKALAKGRDSRAKGLLSKEQYKVYKARVKERQASFKKFMKENR